MQIEIKVTPRAKKTFVAERDGVTRVYVTAPAADGRANEAVVEVLADHFKVKRRQIQIIKGLKTRNKTINIGNI